MTQHSEFGGFITGDMLPESADWPACNTALARYRLSNAVHAYDQATQVRVHHIANAQMASADATSVDPEAVWSFGPYIPFVRADGSTAPLIIRVAGQRSSGTMTVYARLHHIVGQLALQSRGTRGHLRPLQTDGANVTSVAVTSSTHTWYTMPDALSLSAEALAPAYGALPIFTLDNTDERVTVTVPLVNLDIWVDGPAGPSWGLSGVYAREYIG